MVFRLSSEILKDRLLPVTLHMVPIVDHTMSDGIVHAISWRFGVGQSLVADEEVEIFDATLGGEMAWF
jgi:hypothetical protein